MLVSEPPKDLQFVWAHAKVYENYPDLLYLCNGSEIWGCFQELVKVQGRAIHVMKKVVIIIQWGKMPTFENEGLSTLEMCTLQCRHHLGQQEGFPL